MSTGLFSIMWPHTSSGRRLLIAMAALACLNAYLVRLGWLAWSIDNSIDGPNADARWSAPSLSLPAEAGATPLSPASHDPILSRPIFYASRRPFEPPAPRETPAQSTSAAPPADPVFVVDGIVVTTKLRKARIRRPAEPDGQWHEVGGTIDGWAVVAIDNSGVVIEHDGRRLPIALYPNDPRVFRIEPLSRAARLR
jgi:hypothetical protein